MVGAASGSAAAGEVSGGFEDYFEHWFEGGEGAGHYARVEFDAGEGMLDLFHRYLGMGDVLVPKSKVVVAGSIC